MTRPVALITGASAGLGREFATQLARDGYDLVLVARDSGRLEELARELNERFGAKSEVLCADLAMDDDVTRVVERIDRSPIDLLVNNAGFGTKGSLARASRDEQEAMLRVHVLATHRLAQAAAQTMVPRRSGAIINVASVASFLASPGNVNYNSTKAWQRTYIESLSLELRGTGVYAQALCPGYTHTEFHHRVGVDKKRIPDWLWLNADRVVADSLAAVRRQTPVVVVPGKRYKLIVLLARYLPGWIKRLLFSMRNPPRDSGGRTQ